MVSIAGKKPNELAGDFWGGTAAMLVAVPSAIAFGVTIYGAVDSSQAVQGALAGILGATALGLVAPAIGGAGRLISAPCAPAAAVLSAFALELRADGTVIIAALLLMAVVGLAAGVFQLAMGLIRLGTLIRYVPYPVVSGYLSGVGLIIITSQLPPFLGVPKDLQFWSALTALAQWRWQGIAVGALTIAAMLIAPRVTKAVPAPILGLAAGMMSYFGLGLADPALLRLENNHLVLGTLLGGAEGFLDGFTSRWLAITNLSADQFERAAFPALTLAVLLSIDTLKTCVVVDALTRTRHDSNRVLIGQGFGNLVSAAIGGAPGAGIMGGTLVNLSSGGKTRLSGIVEGVLSLLAFLLLAPVIAWIPVAALSGILIVVGFKMIDWHTLRFLKTRDTVLDFVVIAAVITCALTVSLIAASGTGIVLAIFLFIREEIRGTVIRRKVYGNEISSNRIRLQAEREILAARGGQAVIIELQGSLFFGTASQLSLVLEPELKTRKYVILDMRRVQSVDVTAGHVLDQVKDALGEHGGTLIFSHVPHHLPSGLDVQRYFDELGLVRAQSPVKLFDEIDQALEWVEDQIIEDAALQREQEAALALRELELFKDRKDETLTALEQAMETRTFRAGEKIFGAGDTGDELFLIRRGQVRIMLPIAAQESLHLGTFGRGDFFGEMAFLDGEARSADAIAFTDATLSVLPRKRFDALALEHRKIALNLMEGLASVLANRLRHANAELRVLES